MFYFSVSDEQPKLLCFKIDPNPRVKLSRRVPKVITEKQKEDAIELDEKDMAVLLPGYMLALPSDSLETDVLTSERYLERQAQIIKERKYWKLDHLIHTVCEELSAKLRSTYAKQCSWKEHCDNSCGSRGGAWTFPSRSDQTEVRRSTYVKQCSWKEQCDNSGGSRGGAWTFPSRSDQTEVRSTYVKQCSWKEQYDNSGGSRGGAWTFPSRSDQTEPLPKNFFGDRVPPSKDLDDCPSPLFQRLDPALDKLVGTVFGMVQQDDGM